MTASLTERVLDITSDRKTFSHYNSERKIPEDIASLDSWSEALTPDSEDSPSLSTNRRRSSSSSASSKSSVRRRSGKKSANKFNYDHQHHPTRYSINDDTIVLNPSMLSSSQTEPRVERQNLVTSGNHGMSNSSDISHENDIHTQSSRCEPFPSNRPNQFYHNYRHCPKPTTSGTHHNAMYPNLSEFYHYREPYHQAYQSKNSPKHMSKSYQPVTNRQDYMIDSRAIASGSSTFPQYGRNLHTIPLDSEDVDQSERVKNKLISVWNNVKYGWTLKTKTAFRYDSPIFLLGKCYHIRPGDDEPKPGEKTKNVPSMEQFKQDFSSRIWFTYRQDFPPISGTKFSTDCGWGCMLRSGQMLLAQALVTHYLGRDWNVFHHQSREQETYRKQIIRWFGDFLSDDSPFSIHRLVDIGKALGKQPGDWYGPSSVAHIMRDAMVKAYDTQPILSDICVYVAQDCTIYIQDVYDLCATRPRTSTKLSSSMDSEPRPSEAVDAAGSSTSEETVDWKRGVVILIPVRLGGEEFNTAYAPCVKSLLANDSCIGIIGGKPKHSLYFVGWQENKLIYLDPHYCQDAVDSRKRSFPIQTYHCLSPRKILVDKMDPSCTLGFYCRTKADFLTFRKQTEEMVAPPKQKVSYPMFVFNEGSGADLNLDSLSLEEDRLLRIRHVKLDEFGKVRSSTVDSEEFVIL